MVSIIFVDQFAAVPLPCRFRAASVPIPVEIGLKYVFLRVCLFACVLGSIARLAPGLENEIIFQSFRSERNRYI